MSKLKFIFLLAIVIVGSIGFYLIPNPTKYEDKKVPAKFLPPDNASEFIRTAAIIIQKKQSLASETNKSKKSRGEAELVALRLECLNLAFEYNNSSLSKKSNVVVLNPSLCE